MTDDDLTREDRLIHRVIDGSAGVGDWAELELVARRDPSAWHRLAIAMRGELALRRAGAALEERLPSLPIAATPASPSRRSAFAIAAVGWAAALLVGFLWLRPPAEEQGAPGEHPRSAPAVAWAHYLEAGNADGRTIRELPPMVLEATPCRDGTAFDVLFVRRALERATLDEVHELREDDAGRMTSRPVPVANLISEGSL